eukprot:gene4951-8547_t
MPHRKLKNKEENYTTGELIFKSPQGDLNRAYNNETKEEFLIKKSNEEFPSFSLMETFKKDYQFAKMLYQSYPEHFMNVIEMLEQKNGGVVLVAKEDGEGLQVFLEKKKHLDTQEFLKIGIEMTKALHFAHSKQIVHRNVKLANFVISSKSDSVKLIDFGLSVMVSRKSPSVLCTTPTGNEKKLMIWTLDLKKKIDEEVKKIGGMRNILNLNTMSKDFALLMKIMFESLDIVYIASNALSLMYVVNSMVGLFINITRGLSDNSSASLAAAGFCYSFFFKDKAGYELTLVAEQLLSSKKNDENDNFVTTQFHLGIGNMTGGTFKQIKYHMESAIKYAMNHGDFTFGCYSIMHGSESMIFNGANFQKMLSKLQHYQVWLKKIKNVFVSDFMEAMIHFVSDLSDISTFNPKFVLPVDFKCLDTFIPTIEGILRYHKGEFEVALKLFEAAEPVIDHEQGLVDYYEMKFYHCLTLTHVYKTSKDPKHSKRIEEYIKEFKVLSDISPGYLEPRYKLMDLFYRSLTSTDHLMFANDFEEIAESSKNLGLLMIEAVILEILLAFCDDNKFPKAICRLYFNATLEIWKDLSASAKVDQLTKKYYKYISLMSSRRTSGNQSTSSFFSSTSSTNSSIEEIDGNFF